MFPKLLQVAVQDPLWVENVRHPFRLMLSYLLVTYIICAVYVWFMTLILNFVTMQLILPKQLIQLLVIKLINEVFELL